jgi:hypothetical protein
VEVVWADITRARGDLFAVGHYQGVVPQNAEWALDCALSGQDASAADERRLILTDLTVRGVLRGALGDVAFFPWGARKSVVVAGMGRPGTFHREELRSLARSLAATVGRMPQRPTLATVLIGSGAGNLKVDHSVSEMLLGIADALAADRTLVIRRLRLVERSLDRALRALRVVKAVARSTDASQRVDFAVNARLRQEEGGRVPDLFGYSMILAAVARSAGLPEGSPTRAYFEDLLAALPEGRDRQDLAARLQKAGRKGKLRDIALRFPLAEPESGGERRVATRLSFSANDSQVLGTAITGSVTVSERSLPLSRDALTRLVGRLQAPRREDAARLGRGLRRRLVHPDFLSVFDAGGPLVVEVDRALARVQWEMLIGEAVTPEPLGLARTVARQLRTQYSPRPADVATGNALKALVIADPGGDQMPLPDARKEARDVYDVLRKRVESVTLLVGAPLFGEAGVPAAELDVVIDHLLSGEFDLVHYCGHSVPNPSVPGGAGWFFQDGLLTAADLRSMKRPPLLVVANACRSVELGQGGGAALPGAGTAAPPPEAGLVAAVADEFFKSGVADYVGTAWDVPSIPARAFARAFYGHLLGGGSRGNPVALGDAVRVARRKLFEAYGSGGEFATTWGAYQHYGDPTRPLALRRGR